jgi:hypothetical protein
MALLAPSLHGASFLLQDLTSMAVSTNAAEDLVDRVLKEAHKDSSGSDAQALLNLRLRAIRGDIESYEPLQCMAELIEK